MFLLITSASYSMSAVQKSHSILKDSPLVIFLLEACAGKL